MKTSYFRTIGAIAFTVTLLIVLIAGRFAPAYAAAAREGSCVGDCDGNGVMTIDELITMVNIGLGTELLDQCPPGDEDGDNRIAINEIITAVSNTLHGCTAFIATAIPTSQATATSSIPPTAGNTAASTATPTPTVSPTLTAAALFRASLSSDQETPPLDTAATGEAVFTLSADETTLSYELSVSGIADDQIIAAHIHVGPLGVPGPIVIPLAAGSFTSPLRGTLSAADFAPDASDGVNTVADFVAKLRAGGTYVNVHTKMHTGGDIRGQIGVAAILRATLTGDQETPAVTTDNSGQAIFVLSPDETVLSYRLTVIGFTPDQLLAAHIHVGQPGVGGAIVLPLATGAFATPLHGTLSAADFAPDPADGVNTFADLVAKLRAGGTYVNVHTVDHQLGEIRGQIQLADTLHASLSGDQETPPTDTAASGQATFTLSADEMSLSYELSVNGITPEQILAAHIHVAVPGFAGPIVFPLHSGAFTSPLRGTLAAADLAPDPTDGVNTFADFVTKLRAGQTYVNVHTITHNGGEIRGQIGVAIVLAALTGDQETPPINTEGSGNALFILSPDESMLSYQLSVTGLSADQIIAAHIHVAVPGVGGPIVFPLVNGSFQSPLHGTLTASNFSPDAADGVNSFADFVGALRAGNTYVNVHTMAHMGGEIRGQIGVAALLRAMLSGDQETPPVTTAATGVALFILNPGETSLSYQLSVDGIAAHQLLAAHIHVAAPGVPGPIVIPLAGGSFTSPLHGTVTATDLAPDPTDGINSFADFVAKLRAGGAYTNVHTMAHMGGEVRGQITLLTLTPPAEFVAQATDN